MPLNTCSSNRIRLFVRWTTTYGLAFLLGISVQGVSASDPRLLSSSSTLTQQLLLQNEENAATVQQFRLSGSTEQVDRFTYQVVSGDSLSSVFDQTGIGQTEMYQILSADEPLLALDVLRPGQRLDFITDSENGNLIQMELYVHPGKRIIYRRVDDATFEYEEVITEGQWPVRLIAGEIEGNFYDSALTAGLTQSEVAEINRILSNRIDFSLDLQAGDKFEVLRGEQIINGEKTGQTRIKGVHLYLNQGLVTAYLFEDGNYYDQGGHSLTRAFLKSPLVNKVRISSQFDPRRKNPVTGRTAPHNGTDYAVRTGAKVVSTGDGIVTRIASHRFAGKYVEVEHGRRYTSRYLHLSKITVEKGDPVERGQEIGLSGATGRVTGPNLHYEFHINNRPVDYQTSEIPMASSIPKERLAQFKQQAQTLAYIMDNAEPTRLASLNTVSLRH